MTGQDPVVTDRTVSGIDVVEVGPPGQPPSGPGGPRGARARLLCAAWLVAAGALLAPGICPGVHVLLRSADHTGIAIPVMLALLVVDPGRQRWYQPVAAGVLLAWAQLDDPVATYACALPLAVVCAVRAAAA